MAKWITELRKVRFAMNVLFDERFRSLLVDTLEYAERASDEDEHGGEGISAVVMFFSLYEDKLFTRRRVK